MADGGGIQIRYQASRTLAAFHADESFVRGVRGPIGSGKSVGCVMEVFRRASLQKIGPDKKRRSRWAIVRNTYPELKSTTIKTWQDWFPEEICPLVYDSPIRGHLSVGDIELEVLFIALDKPKDVKKLKSLELTGIWLNEASELPKSILDMATGRVGRYPAKKDGGSSWSGVIMDTNPPDTDHWWYRLAEIHKIPGYAFFAQPPALIKQGDNYRPNASAENIENHSEGFNYYLRQIQGKKPEWIKVFILGEYGSVMAGKPVWTNYRDSVHCPARELEVLRGLPLFIGIDFGRTPAAVICQYTLKGQLRVIDELVTDPTGDGMTVRAFARDVLRPHLANHYTDMTVVARGDPAGKVVDNSELDCFQILAEEGIPCAPASTNDIQPRIDAVDKFMLAMPDGEPGFLISTKCTVMRKGLLGGYQFTRIQVSGDERYRDVPDKNRYSHPADALQYAALAVADANHIVVVARKRPVQQRSAKGWT